jgi:glycerophosphoryl diester phosphodiesterase
LLGIHIAVNVLVVVLLGPLAGLMLRLAIALSGDAALSDQDILFFALSPSGFAAFITLASVFSIIVFLEYAALISAAWLQRAGSIPTATRVLHILAGKARQLFLLALQILLRVIAWLLPYAVALGAVYLALISEFDINFYLAEKPPEWSLAVALAGLVLIAAGAHMLWLTSGWIFALPLLLNGEPPRAALTGSRQAVRGQRVRILGWIIAWLALITLAAALGSALVAVVGRLLTPESFDGIRVLLFALAGTSLLSFLVSFAVTFVGAASLSLLIVSLYAERAPAGIAPVPAVRATDLPGIRWSVPVILTGLAVAFVVSVFTVDRTLNGLRFENVVEIVAHRGASAAAPENTLAAVEAAIASGAEWVEIDVQETGDGKVAVIHDGDLKRVGGVPLTVAGSSLAELQRVDVGSWFGPGFSDQRVPSLEEVLRTCKGRIGVNIELKYYGGEE